VRVLQLTDLYRPVVGGLERFVEIISAGLVEAGHEVAVATNATAAAPAGRSADEVVPGVQVHRLTGWQHTLLRPYYASAERPFHPTAPDPGMIRALGRVVRTFRPDVIHAHSWNVFSVLPLAHRLGLPVLIQAHDYGLVCHRKTMLRDGAPCAGPSLGRCIPCGTEQYGAPRSAALALALRGSRPLLGHARVTAVSRYVASRLTPVLGPTAGPVGVLNSFVPDGLPEIARTAAPPAGLPDRGFVLFVGALTAVKGLDVLLEAHHRLTRNRHVGLPLVLIGTRQVDTPQAARLGPDVTVLENLPHPQVLAAMRRASVVMAPSVWPDPLPMTVTEAQLAGTPVVASRIGGIPEQLDDGRTGLLVPPGDPGALAAALDALLADPARRAAMGAAGPRWAARLTAAHGVPAIEQALHVLVATSPASAR
jgi:glycosyltransferase involved in cell wall biosynthesis